jgi:hypothetical protein
MRPYLYSHKELNSAYNLKEPRRGLHPSDDTAACPAPRYPFCESLRMRTTLSCGWTPDIQIIKWVAVSY